MAHDIASVNGKTSMAYFGEVPWHRLGTKLDEPATAAEAIAAAGLDYEVALQSLWTSDGDPVGMRQAVVRCDNSEVLGVVGRGYQPIQNFECFGFLDSVVADGKLRYHTAGALGRGERIWMLAKLPGEIRIRGSEDVTEKYLLLSNSHDGTSALRVFFTPIRVVCANTLAIAERRSRKGGVSIAHKGDIGAKVKEAREILGFANQFYDHLEIQLDRLAAYHPTRQQLQNYFEMLYPDPLPTASSRTRNVRGTLMQLFESGAGQEIQATKRSAWSAFNAVAEYVDHHRATRGGTKEAKASRRFQSAWFGAGVRRKAEAWKQALAMLN
ncbi:DUF932 domain-containing protein [Lacipirellula sp.]|uniref:DUF932 domain-containing protein n=1 Tax=Lacipirellula sp. TaxID=2691419 RepID=UPI003D0CC10E